MIAVSHACEESPKVYGTQYIAIIKDLGASNLLILLNHVMPYYIYQPYHV